MNKLIGIFLLLLCSSFMLSAQGVYVDTDATAEDYERFIENYLKVDFRGKAIQSMELTEDEIIAFDPLYNEYSKAKRALLQKKFDLTSEYKDEMAEDDTAKDEEEETSEFIENYWEIEIKEMELKKDFFDRFEDIMSNRQAINFFVLEESMQTRIDRPNLVKVVPMIVEFEVLDEATEKNEKDSSYNNEMNKDSDTKATETWSTTEKDMTANTDANERRTEDGVIRTKEQAMALSSGKGQIVNETASEVETGEKTWTNKEAATTENNSELPSKEEALALTQKDRLNETTAAITNSNDKITAFSNWLETNKNGVAIDHEYTHDGLNHLFNAVWTIADNEGIDVTAWSTQKEKVTSMADQLRVDPYSTDHADITRKAFIMIAEMMDVVSTKEASSEMKMDTESMMSAAKSINPDELMTKQADKIYNFFEKAQESINKISVLTTQTSASESYDNK